MLVEKNTPLQDCNTFGIVASADTLVRIRSTADVLEFVRSDLYRGRKVFVLGGGSNIVLTGDVVDAVVLKMEVPGIALAAETDSHWIIEAGAGVRWHDLVAWTIAHGYPGLENLALVPGTVGAAPVQNIGAYGVELQDRFHELDAVDLVQAQTFTLNAAQCAFGYRDSLFKRQAGRWLILRVRFALQRTAQLHLDYGPVRQWLAEQGVVSPTPLDVSRAICSIRRERLPDPAVLGNAGSFFKNPLVSAEQAERLRVEYPDLIAYPQGNGTVKLAAGWLLERAGWKGYRDGDAGVHRLQALVLVNHGRATGKQVLALARRIREDIERRFGVSLEVEPSVI